MQHCIPFLHYGYPALPERPIPTAICISVTFHDTLHHMPVVRHAVIASSFGLRFQGEGFFLTDACTHRGTSGAPVVMREQGTMQTDLPWILLGIHSTRLDVDTRDQLQDDALGLNCVWYADILLKLTERR